MGRELIRADRDCDAWYRNMKGSVAMNQLRAMRAVALGVLWGGLAGVTVGLLLAPASGSEIRQRLQEQATAVRDNASQAVEDARAKAEALQANGREMLEDNKRRITRTVEAARDGAAVVWKAESAVISAKAAKSSQVGSGESVPAYQMIH
jgi:gas vesicle protein